MVSHQDAIPATDEAEAGVPGGEEQKDDAGRADDRLPGNGD